jgi:hypothetical protein
MEEQIEEADNKKIILFLVIAIAAILIVISGIVYTGVRNSKNNPHSGAGNNSGSVNNISNAGNISANQNGSRGGGAGGGGGNPGITPNNESASGWCVENQTVDNVGLTRGSEPANTFIIRKTFYNGREVCHVRALFNLNEYYYTIDYSRVYKVSIVNNTPTIIPINLSDV